MRDGLCREELPPRPLAVLAGAGAGTGAEAGAELRTAPRFTLLIRAAKLVSPAGEFLCVIRDASETGISVRTFHVLAQGEAMRIVLQNGDEHPVEPVWQELDRAGFRFAGPVEIARIIESPSRFAKREIRLNMRADAEVAGIGGKGTASLCNLSQRGAAIATSMRLAIGQRVRLCAGGLPETRARVRWRNGDQYGLAFEETFQFGELARIAHLIQRA